MKNLILAISLFVFLSFSVSSSERINGNNVMPENVNSSEKRESHFSNLLDSAEDEIPEVSDPLKDVSGMFNERGYYKSNGFSFDDQEIINDFNGNLMYSVPLYNYALGGDLNLQMKLTYNGSVGHIITTSDTDKIRTQASIYSRRNINFPEWIIDLNGFALQTFNFETNFFTSKNAGSNYISGSSVNAIISGYHYDNELRDINYDNKDKINIFMGDGSTITLENTDFSGDGQNPDNYVGNYIYKGREMYYKAIVTYINTPIGNIGNNPRKVVLSKGDGIEYIFEEVKIHFDDFRTDTSLVNAKLRPMAIYLKEIRDRFSHFIKISYSQNHPFPIVPTEKLKGRQLLKSVTTSGISSTINNPGFWFEYGPSICKIFHQSELNGNYSIFYDTPVGYRTSDNYKNQRGTAGKIINILNQRTEFTYSTYVRRYDNLYGLYSSGSAPNLEVSLNDLRRMKSSKTNLGLKRDYLEYLAPDSMSINLVGYYGEDDHRSVISSSSSTIYKGYGRDPFFVNMLKKKSDSVATIFKSETSFEYSYTYSRTFQNVQDRPVSDTDGYSSTKTVTSKETLTQNNSVTSLVSQKSYKVYPVFNTNNSFEISQDKNGITKLTKDENIKAGTSNKYMTTSYGYEIGSYSSAQQGYEGSFLNSNKKEYPESMTSYNEWNWSYTYQNNNPNKPPIQITEYDPLGGYAITDFAIYDTSFWHKEFSNDIVNNIYVKSYYYKINLPVKERKFSPNGDSLQKKTFTYISDTSSTLGYYGQLISEKVYKYPAFNEVIEINYEYCKKDTAGKSIFLESGSFPYKEGNLKLIRTNDKETKFFYNPISFSEVYISGITDEDNFVPYLRYKIKYNNGNIVDTTGKIWDNRFPIRTDVYEINGNNRDTLSITYKTYTLDGSPSKMIDQNKYLTQFVYEPIHRINSITLPGDFSTLQDSLVLDINHNYIQTNTDLQINGYGYFSYNIDSLFYTTNFNLLQSGCCPKILDSTRMVNEIYTHRRAALLFFDTNNVNQIANYSTFDSVNLNLLVGYSNNFPSNIGQTRIQIVREISSSTAEHTCGDCGFPPSPVKLFSRKITSFGGSENVDTLIANSTNSFNIKSIIPTDKKMIGILILPVLSSLQTEPYPDHNFSHSFSGANLEFYGTFDNADTLKIPIIKGGTIKYYYDDLNHKVNVYSVRNSLTNDRSRIQYDIDGYGNVKQKDIFTSNSDSNTYRYKFNYMNQPAENLDALDQYTKYSYDGLGRLIKTKNADTSSTQNLYSYYNGMTYYFGNVNGIVEKQTFKDEEGKPFEKYFDAVGNIRKEVKYVSYDPNEESYTVPLITEYKYDSLYRVTQVRTPEGKNIYYSYDGYGRQSKRITPDAGTTNFVYDKNSNLIYSQDANQNNINANKYTFRNYDGANRLTGIGEALFEYDNPYDGIQYVPSTLEHYLTINVYDTISPSVVDNLFTGVSGYTSALNYTKGNLAATAYRTIKTDRWNFKYYRYDVRGRVIKMWNIISGFDTLTTDYTYNSQDQVILYSHSGHGETKTYKNTYDYTGRLQMVDYQTEFGAPIPTYTNVCEYEYNPNSQISYQKYYDSFMQNDYTYNERNWITLMDNSAKLFDYSNQYFMNGNVKSIETGGDYSQNFASPSTLSFDYKYDKSNRLTEATTPEKYFEVKNTYDKDGNILTLDRFGSTGSPIDDFNYVYYSGTNKLQRVSGSGTQYTYDANGNMTSDALNKNSIIKYDHRNLITELQHLKYILNDSITYYTYYSYDEAGNRYAKTVYRYTGAGNPTDTPNEDIDGFHWVLDNTEIYSRDVSGREMAIYKNDTLQEYPVYGLDMIGKIKENELYFYIKDHLGSVRVVTDAEATVINCQDYDPWGYILENRVYQYDESIFKFTSKERDEESFYDYFGARYYDARVGRWGGIDPLLEKHFDFSPYNYVLDNPLFYIDPDGQQVDVVRTVFSIYNWYRNEQIRSEYNNSLSLVGKQQQYLEYVESMGSRGRIESAEIQPGDIIGGVAIGVKSASKLSIFSKELSTGSLDDQLFIHTKHSLESISKIEASTGIRLTDEIIGEAISKSQVFTGHKSGGLTLISEGTFPGGQNLVIGQNPITKKLITVYPSSQTIDKLGKDFIKISETFSKEVIKSAQKKSGF